MKLILLAVLFSLVCSGYCRLKTDEELAREVVVVDSVPGQKLRAYDATVFPLVNPRIVKLVGLALQKNTNSKGGSIDVVEFDLNTLWQMSLAFGYFHAESDVPANNTGGATGSASAFAFLLRMFTVFEFDDNNGVEGYQNGTSDSINGYYDLSNIFLTWKPLVVNHTMVTDSNGNQFKVWFITAQTVDEVFLLRFTIAGTPLSVGGVHITPDSVKVDFQVNWFTALHVPAAWTPSGPSSATAHPQAKVGVAMAMAAFAESAQAKTDGSGNEQPQVTFGTAGYVGFFNWNSTADVTVQGVEAARGVTADVQETDDPNVQAAFKAGWIIRAMWFSFNGTRPSSVAWDPQVGTNVDYTNSASSNIVVVAFIAFLLLFV